jgi:hypothetical protein
VRDSFVEDLMTGETKGPKAYGALHTAECRVGPFSDFSCCSGAHQLSPVVMGPTQVASHGLVRILNRFGVWTGLFPFYEGPNELRLHRGVACCP